MPRLSDRLTDAEIDHLDYTLQIAITKAEDLGLDDDQRRLGRILDTLHARRYISALDQIFLGQFYE